MSYISNQEFFFEITVILRDYMYCCSEVWCVWSPVELLDKGLANLMNLAFLLVVPLLVRLSENNDYMLLKQLTKTQINPYSIFQNVFDI